MPELRSAISSGDFFHFFLPIAKGDSSTIFPSLRPWHELRPVKNPCQSKY